MVEKHLTNKKKSINSGISKSESSPEDFKMLGNDLNREIAVHSVKRKLERFESTLLADVQKKMDNVIEDIIQEIQQYELNAQEFKEFAQEQHDQTWSNRIIKTAPTATGAERNSDSRQFREKIFIPRDSYLTSLLEVNHMKAIYHIFYIIFSIIVTQNLLLSYLKDGRFNIGLQTVAIGFNNFDYVILVWVLMELAVFGIYFLFKFWANVRHALRKNPVLQGLWSYLNLIGFIAFQLTFAALATMTCSQYDFSFVSSSVTLLEMTRFMMKMHSFVRYNVPRQMAGKLKTDEDETTTSEMPKFSSYVYFLMAPTLLYRDSYPRTKQIRWKFVFGKAVEMFSVILFLGSVNDTYIYPYFSKTGIEKMTFLELTEKGFKMILPGVMIFLCGFFCILHIWQNFTSEILMFADRMFYKDWWTSKNYETYYRNWNVIVHDWLYEYIYKDMYMYVCRGSKPLASLAVFAASAFVHEYIMGFALRFAYPALSGFFLFSVILLFLMKKLHANVGNLFIWWSLVVGNSLLIMLYSLEFFARKNCQIGNDWINYVKPVSWYCNGLEN